MLSRPPPGAAPSVALPRPSLRSLLGFAPFVASALRRAPPCGRRTPSLQVGAMTAMALALEGMPRWLQHHPQQGPRQSAGGLSRPLRACDSLWACITGEVNGLLPCTRCRGWLGSEADPSLPRQCFGTHLPCGRCLPPRLVPVLSPLAWPYPWLTPNGPRLAWRMGWSSFCPARELE